MNTRSLRNIKIDNHYQPFIFGMQFKVLDGLGNHDTQQFGDQEVSFESVSNLRNGSAHTGKGWTLTDYWTTR